MVIDTVLILLVVLGDARAPPEVVLTDANNPGLLKENGRPVDLTSSCGRKRLVELAENFVARVLHQSRLTELSSLILIMP